MENDHTDSGKNNGTSINKNSVNNKCGGGKTKNSSTSTAAKTCRYITPQPNWEAYSCVTKWSKPIIIPATTKQSPIPVLTAAINWNTKLTPISSWSKKSNSLKNHCMNSLHVMWIKRSKRWTETTRKLPRTNFRARNRICHDIYQYLAAWTETRKCGYHELLILHTSGAQLFIWLHK